MQKKHEMERERSVSRRGWRRDTMFHSNMVVFPLKTQILGNRNTP